VSPAIHYPIGHTAGTTGPADYRLKDRPDTGGAVSRFIELQEQPPVPPRNEREQRGSGRDGTERPAVQVSVIRTMVPPQLYRQPGGQQRSRHGRSNGEHDRLTCGLRRGVGPAAWSALGSADQVPALLPTVLADHLLTSGGSSGDHCLPSQYLRPAWPPGSW